MDKRTSCTLNRQVGTKPGVAVVHRRSDDVDPKD